MTGGGGGDGVPCLPPSSSPFPPLPFEVGHYSLSPTMLGPGLLLTPPPTVLDPGPLLPLHPCRVRPRLLLPSPAMSGLLPPPCHIEPGAQGHPPYCRSGSRPTVPTTASLEHGGGDKASCCCLQGVGPGGEERGQLPTLSLPSWQRSAAFSCPEGS